MQERLKSLASRLDALALRIRTLGLVRAAEDLSSVSAELRRICSESAARPAKAPPCELD